MGVEVNFFVKQANGTIPLKVAEPSMVISQLLKHGSFNAGTDSYHYEDLRIQKKTVSIFVTLTTR
ncbi:hypothetical protein ACFYKX_13500 [Cytobacillus sp. FJAT-54145]|uniref:Uncharacterized protein n=1 Tax=Cytobacillus spartinae TaxID=3299023 RepID=A0ABW6KBT2_9BACI